MHNVQFFFLSLVAYCHDMVAVSGLRDRGVVHAVGPVAHSMDEAVALVARQLDEAAKEQSLSEAELILQEEEDGEMRWLNGISVQVNNTHERIMRQFRDVQDVLDHNIEDLARVNPEVKNWVEEQGGIAKLNETLSGKDLTSPRGWFKTTQRYFKRVLGHVPPAFGRPTKEHADSATEYGGYAVSAHRIMTNRRAYGELPDLEGENDWATTETNLSQVPGWYRRITYSQALVGVHKKAPYRGPKEGKVWLARQIADGLKGKLHRLKPVLCFGPNFGGAPYTNVYEKYTEAQVDRNPDVQRLLYRFRNEPERLVWKRIPIFGGKLHTWVAGVRTAKGNYLWLSLSKKSNELFDWATNNGENVIRAKINFDLPPRAKGDTYDKYVYVNGHRTIRTKMKGDVLLVTQEATKDYPNWRGQSYVQICKIWEEEMTPKQWGAKKKRLLKEGWQAVRIRKGTVSDNKEMEI